MTKRLLHQVIDNNWTVKLLMGTAAALIGLGVAWATLQGKVANHEVAITKNAQEIEKQHLEVSGDIDKIQLDVFEIRGDVREIKQNQKNIETGITEIKENLKAK